MYISFQMVHFSFKNVLIEQDQTRKAKITKVEQKWLYKCIMYLTYAVKPSTCLRNTVIQMREISTVYNRTTEKKDARVEFRQI